MSPNQWNRDFWCHRLAGHGAGEGSQAEGRKSSSSFAQIPALQAGRDGFCRELGSAQPQKSSPSSGLEHVEVPLPSRITCC